MLNEQLNFEGRWKPLSVEGGIVFVDKLGFVRKPDLLVDVDYAEKPQQRLYAGGILSQRYTEQGYLEVRPYGKGLRVHRLVCIAWLMNTDPETYTDVNHKSGVKDDNRLDNLEWCTRAFNVQHSFAELGRVGAMTGKFNGLHHSSIPIIGRDPLTSEVKHRFPSMSEAARFGFDLPKISMAVNGKLATHKGLKWEADTASESANV